ncbi:MAG: aminoglycoside phosphotransferase family protein [Alphaproteobacteria bacterium]|nr:aminoglycoside phosphotransferase family protein [Alphaproteobacteria bacterium]
MYVIAKSTPDEIADLVPDDAKPRGTMNGWCHTDICGNFIVDANTMQIVSVIDWENAQFGDFYWRLYRTHRPEKRALFDAVEREYWRLFNKDVVFKK